MFNSYQLRLVDPGVEQPYTNMWWEEAIEAFGVKLTEKSKCNLSLSH